MTNRASADRRAPRVGTHIVDDFRDRGKYSEHWTFPFALDPSAVDSRAVADGLLRLRAVPFTMSFDDVHDHHKYLAFSVGSFAVPAQGSIAVSASIEARVSGIEAVHVVPSTRRTVPEVLQAAATLHLMDPSDTGIVLDWFVSERKAIPLWERLLVPGVTIETAYTQIVDEFDIGPGPHEYIIRYRRATDSDRTRDVVEYLIDGEVKAAIPDTGVPLDRRAESEGRAISVFPSLGSGERLRDRIRTFVVAHGLFSVVDEFPFNQAQDKYRSIPRHERLFGQGIDAVFGPVVVTIESH